MRVRPSYVLALTGSTLLMAACAQPAGPVQSGTSTDVGAGAASQSPPNGCLIGSIDNLMTSHPLTVEYQLSRILKGASVMLVGGVKAGTPIYGTSNGERPKLGHTFQIFTPWVVTDGKQWVGTAPNQLLTEGGAIGCDKESNGLTSALDSGGSALIVAQPFLVGMPKDTYSITESWQVVGDRVLIPQPKATVGDGLDATTVDSMRYNGKDVSGSSISLAALRAVINRLATER